MRLFRAELNRLVSRRFTRIMTGIVLVLLIAVGIDFAVTSHKHNAAARATALAQIEQMHQQQLGEQRLCEAQQSDPNSAPADGPHFPPGFDCSQLGNFTVTEDQVESFEPHEFSFRNDTGDSLSVVGLLLALLAFVVGASFVGAEWSTGGMMNLLLWRPRRLPLLSGKLAALTVAALTTGVVLSVGWLVALWGIASTRGDASRITNGLLTSLALTDLRALALVLAAAVLGFSIASVGRHTATALGVAIGYVVVLEIGARIVLQLADVTRPQRFFLSSYVSAWLNKSQIYVDYRACQQQIGYSDCEPTRWLLHMNQSAVIGAVLIAVVLLWAFVSFRRRDIT